MPKKLSFKQLLGLTFLIAGVFLTTGCVSPGQQAAESAVIAPDINLLRVGVTPNAPPLIFKQGDKIVGLEADLARELAKYLDKSPRFVELEWEDQIPALLENRIDIIMSGMSITRLREVRVAFSIPYFKSGQMALIRREDAARFSTGFFALSTSSSIGVIKDTTGEYFVETNYSNVKTKTFSTPGAAVKAVIDKKIENNDRLIDKDIIHLQISTLNFIGYLFSKLGENVDYGLKLTKIANTLLDESSKRSSEVDLKSPPHSPQGLHPQKS